MGCVKGIDANYWTEASLAMTPNVGGYSRISKKFINKLSKSDEVTGLSSKFCLIKLLRNRTNSYYYP